MTATAHRRMVYKATTWLEVRVDLSGKLEFTSPLELNVTPRTTLHFLSSYTHASKATDTSRSIDNVSVCREALPSL